VPAEALPHLFERFYRAPNSVLHHVGGIGIGLTAATAGELIVRDPAAAAAAVIKLQAGQPWDK
jgi:signal transduction histidine kinase